MPSAPRSSLAPEKFAREKFAPEKVRPGEVRPREVRPGEVRPRRSPKFAPEKFARRVRPSSPRRSSPRGSSPREKFAPEQFAPAGTRPGEQPPPPPFREVADCDSYATVPSMRLISMLITLPPARPRKAFCASSSSAPCPSRCSAARSCPCGLSCFTTSNTAPVHTSGCACQPGSNAIGLNASPPQMGIHHGFIPSCLLTIHARRPTRQGAVAGPSPGRSPAPRAGLPVLRHIDEPPVLVPLAFLAIPGGGGFPRNALPQRQRQLHFAAVDAALHLVPVRNRWRPRCRFRQASSSTGSRSKPQPSHATGCTWSSPLEAHRPRSLSARRRERSSQAPLPA